MGGRTDAMERMHGGRQRPPLHLLPRKAAEPGSGEGDITVPEKRGWGVRGHLVTAMSGDRNSQVMGGWVLLGRVDLKGT